MRRLLLFLMAALVAVSMLPAASFGEVTEAKTPSGIANTSLKWQYDFQSGGMDFAMAPTVPALIEGAIYTGASKKVYKLDKNTGKILAKSNDLSGTMGWGTTPIIGDSSGVYVFVAGSKVIKLSLDLKSVIWTSNTYGGQNICPLKLIDGRIYGGTWNDKDGGGTFFCLNADNGKSIWTKYDEEGFYWSGAVKSGNTVFFTSDAFIENAKGGRSSSIMYAVPSDGETPEVALTLNNTRIRSTPAVDEEGFLYVTSINVDEPGGKTKKGAVTKYKYDDTKAVGQKMIPQGSYTIEPSTNTPVIDGDNIFVGDGNIMVGGAKGKLYVIDRKSMELKTKAEAPGPIQGEVCVSKGNGRYVVYIAYNNKPGGIYQVEMPFSADTIAAKGQTFVPQRHEFCLSSVICDDNTGVLFYKNDAGVIMAVKSGVDTAAVKGVKAETVNPTTIKVSWRSRENAEIYTVYYSKDGKKYKSAGKTKETEKSIKGLKYGTRYHVKVKATLLKGSTKYSKVVKAVPGPEAPKVTVKNKKAGKVRISWKKPKKAEGYAVYRATKQDGKYKAIGKIKKANTKSFVDKKAKKGKTYFYKVRPYGKLGKKTVQGAWSTEVKVKIK